MSTASQPRLARWAVGLAAVSGLAAAGTIATIAIAYAAGAEETIEDTWAGTLLAAIALGLGLGCSLLAFVLAIVARARHDRDRLLWLPLCTFPAVVLLLALGEAFWWE